VARFEWMGGWRGAHGAGTVRFYPFDLLRLDGVDVRDRPWQERTDRLRDRLEAGSPDGCQAVTSSDDGPGMWAATVAIGAEGVVAKRRDSRYHSGRSRWWLKTKHRETAWFDVAGWRPTTPGRPGGLVVAQGDDVGSWSPKGTMSSVWPPWRPMPSSGLDWLT
jgi:ATP-dependent DNA ligase